MKTSLYGSKKVKKDKRLDPVSTMVRLRCDMPCTKCRKSSQRPDVSHAISCVRGHLRALPMQANSAQTQPGRQARKGRFGTRAERRIKPLDAPKQPFAARSRRNAPPRQPTAQTMLVRSIQSRHQGSDREYLSARCPAIFQPRRKQALDLAVGSAKRHLWSRYAHGPKYSVSFGK